MSTKKTLEEHLNRIKIVSGINEAKVSLINDIEQDDMIPDEVWVSPENEVQEADDEISDELPEKNLEEPEAEADIENTNDFNDPTIASTDDIESIDVPQVEDGIEEPQQSADDVQNEIMKLNISAMKKMNSEIDNIHNMHTLLMDKIDGLNKNVEDVKEPTNIEKLTARKNDSHPFYYNLNDMWDGNTFQARRQIEGEGESMKKLEDGTYIADFDTLPQYNDNEIKDSFDNDDF